MKRFIWTLMLATLALTASSQKSADAIFDSLRDKDGYVTVNINGGLLKLAALFEDDDKDLEMMASTVSQIRIIAQEDNREADPQFYQNILKQLDSSNYEEFMDIQSSGTRAKILVRLEGNVFTEFLMVVGGDDNALIQIKGKMTESDIKRMAEDIHYERDGFFR
ncbi:MAG: DUF4252 domain-containing protein [Bacteroidales bacterium]|nr:DUF4252 domain-containing protein [Bacteroidales bacterium]